MTRKTESELEAKFYNRWVELYPQKRPATQYRFHPTRKFRFDFAWPRNKIAVEVQGMGPGHFSLPGATADYDKNLEALLLNWRIVYLTSTMLSPRKIDVNCRRIARLLGVKELAQPTKYVPLRRRK